MDSTWGGPSRPAPTILEGMRMRAALVALAVLCAAVATGCGSAPHTTTTTAKRTTVPSRPWACASPSSERLSAAGARGCDHTLGSLASGAAFPLVIVSAESAGIGAAEAATQQHPTSHYVYVGRLDEGAPPYESRRPGDRQWSGGATRRRRRRARRLGAGRPGGARRVGRAPGGCARHSVHARRTERPRARSSCAPGPTDCPRLQGGRARRDCAWCRRRDGPRRRVRRCRDRRRAPAEPRGASDLGLRAAGRRGRRRCCATRSPASTEAARTSCSALERCDRRPARSIPDLRPTSPCARERRRSSCERLRPTG